MILQVVSLPIRPDKKDELMVALAGLVEASRAEDGVNLYLATTRTDEPNIVVMIEEYADKEALASHRAQAHTQQAFSQLPAYLAGAPEFRVYQVSNVTVQSQP